MMCIMSMHAMNLKTIDLNLLVALKALLDEKHVSRAAERIGLSQSAMSHALSRLRKTLQDPLLVRDATGLCLTVRARELQLPLKNILTEIHQIISPPTEDPRYMAGEITIAARDYEIATILPHVIQQITHDAPNLKLNILTTTDDHLGILEHNKVDFVLTGSESKSSTLCRHVLFQEDFVCMISANNAENLDKITLEKYLELKHCMVTLGGFGPGVVDLALHELGLERDVAVRVPYFLCSAYIITHSNLVITLPRRIARLLNQLQVKLFEPPLQLETFPIYMYWHVKNQTNPVHKWVRQVIRSVESNV